MNYIQLNSVTLKEYGERVGLGITPEFKIVAASYGNLLFLDHRASATFSDVQADNLYLDHGICITKSRIITYTNIDSLIYDMSGTKTNERITKDRDKSISQLVFHDDIVWGADFNPRETALYKYSEGLNLSPKKIDLYELTNDKYTTITGFGSTSKGVTVLLRDNVNKPHSLRIYNAKEGKISQSYIVAADQNSKFASFDERIYISKGNHINVYDTNNLDKKKCKPAYQLVLGKGETVVSIATRGAEDKKILAAIVKLKDQNSLELRIFEEDNQKKSKKK